jgi:hypothetical protein
MSVFAAILVGLLAAAPTPDAAAAPVAVDTASDVRCLIVTFKATSSENPAAKTAGLIGSMYFLGRLDGRTPNADLESQIIAQIKTMTSADYKAEAVRCGEILVVKGKTTTDMGHDLMKKGQQMMQLENSR